MRGPVVITFLSSLLIAGCALTRTHYVRPSVPFPERFEYASPESRAAVSGDAWWRSFGDPALDQLIERALARNPDLAAAAVRVRRATLEASLAGNTLLPVPNGSLTVAGSRALSGAAERTETSSGTLGVSWEADLFGRIVAQRDAARFEAAATAEDRDATLLSLVGTAAVLHWQIAFANERIALGEESLEYARRTQALVESQYRAGAVSSLELREVEQTVSAQAAALSQLRQTRTEVREAVRVLLDGEAPPAPEPQALGRAALPSIAAGLPAELLGRRPDLRAAELRLRGTLSSSDATRASYYPALTLTGALGVASASLAHVLANPVETLGASVTLPFLNVRAMRLDGAIARARYEEAVILFRQRLYTALAEAENALSARITLAEQGEELLRARDAAAEAERLYEVRYRAGQVALRTWLDAQERRRTADLTLSANRLAQLQNHVVLHQVIGGGFGLGSP